MRNTEPSLIQLERVGTVLDRSIRKYHRSKLQTLIEKSVSCKEVHDVRRKTPNRPLLNSDEHRV